MPYGQQRQAFDVMYPDNKGFGEQVEYKKRPPPQQSQQYQPHPPPQPQQQYSQQPHPQTSQWEDVGTV